MRDSDGKLTEACFACFFFSFHHALVQVIDDEEEEEEEESSCSNSRSTNSPVSVSIADPLDPVRPPSPTTTTTTTMTVTTSVTYPATLFDSSPYSSSAPLPRPPSPPPASSSLPSSSRPECFDVPVESCGDFLNDSENVEVPRLPVPLFQLDPAPLEGSLPPSHDDSVELLSSARTPPADRDDNDNDDDGAKSVERELPECSSLAFVPVEAVGADDVPLAESTILSDETPLESSTKPVLLVPTDVMLSSISSNGSNDSVEADSLNGPCPTLQHQELEEMERDSLDEEEADQDQQLEEDDYIHVDDAQDEDLSELEAIILSQQQQQRQQDPPLWRTVIMEESEPSCSGDASGPSSLDRTVDSGIVKDGPGPITQAVTQWLESAPLEQQLIAGTLGEEDDQDDDDDDDDQGFTVDDLEEEEAEKIRTAPKNELTNPCTAPSSEHQVTDGPQRRVGSASSPVAAGRDGPATNEDEDEPLSQPYDCDPAKFSVYYQLGVTVDEDDDDDNGDRNGKGDGDEIQQCPLASPQLAGQEKTKSSVKTNKKTKKKSKKDRPKRHSWRRILLARQTELHKTPDGDDSGSGVLKTRRPKAGQSCCAVQ